MAIGLPVFSFVFTVLILGFLLRSRLALRVAADIPNHRSLHSIVVPRVGGLVLVPSFVLSWMGMADRDVVLASLVSILALLSYLDDRSNLPVVLRFAGQVAITVIFLFSRFDLSVMLAFAALWIVWCTNLFNFMDGADGLAGGMAVFGFAALGAAASIAGSESLMLSCLSIAGAALGFLFFNFPPAKTFMGDAGSIPLGFLVGAMGLQYWHAGFWPLWFPVLVFSPFIVDATATLCKRAVKLEKVWVAHHDHYYQRLVRMGWSHRRLALHEYALMAACGASALVLLRCGKGMQFAGLAAWAVIYGAAMMKIDLCWKKFSATSR